MITGRRFTVLGLLGILLFAGTSVCAQTTLYSDDFSGSGAALNGAMPDVTIGANAWAANSAFNDNGTITLADEGSALLPFSPVVNATYELSMDVTNPGNEWIGLGFASDPIANAGASSADDRLSNNANGIAWMLYRNNGGVDAIQSFAGPNVTGPLDLDNTGINFSVQNELKVIINTAGDGSSFTADWLINDASLRSEIVNLPVADLSFVGLTYNNTADMAVSYDNFLLTELITGVVSNEWTVDGGGVFGTAGNWTMGSPSAGDTVLFGGVLTAANSPGVVTLDSPASLAEVQFSNTGASYTLSGPSTLTLTGSAVANTISGTHEIAAVIAGSNGLTKTGTGELIISGNNTYTGGTDIQAGVLRVINPSSVNGAINVADGASLFFQGDDAGGGYNATVSNAIEGAGAVELSASLTTETVTFNSAKTYTGQTRLRSGTLRVSGSGTLGASDGTAATQTVVDGGDTTEAKIELAGNAAVGNEVLVLAGRQNAAIDAPHLSNVSGTNSWSGNIRGDVSGGQYNIESQSGTLTLSGNLAAPDDGDRTYVFSGAGNTTITGKLADFTVDEDGNSIDIDTNMVPDNAVDNVNVIKRGSGTLTIATATGGSEAAFDYHRGTTAVEQGTLRVQGNGSTLGELLSSDIAVRDGATMQIASFTTYNQQTGQTFGGSGTINTGGATLGLFGDGNLAPGDSVGTLTIEGNVNLNRNAGIAGGVLRYELGNSTTVGGAENDLVQINGSLSTTAGTDTMTVEVSPVEGTLASGNYRLINHTSGGAANVTGMAAQVVNQLGDVLNTRQTLQVTSTAGQVNLQVTGSSANLTWNGTGGNNTWNVATSNNWTGGATSFLDLDNATFGSAGEKNVIVSTTVTPGSTTFDGGAATTYTLGGNGGIAGAGPVNIASGTVALNNTGNNYIGTTTVASGARLEMVAASTGSMLVNGTLQLVSNSSTVVVDDFDTPGLGEYTFSKVLDVNGGTVTNVSFSDAAGTIDVTSTGADGPEQVLLLRDDFTLNQGEELRIDAPTTFNDRDFGLAIGQAHADLGNGNGGDNRSSSDYLFMAWRNLDQLNSRGFNGNAEVALQQNFDANAETLFISRLPNDDIELGWYSGGVRNVTWTATPTTLDIFSNVGFYADIRVDGNGFAGADNLRIVTGTGSDVIEVDGDFDLAADGTLEVDLANSGFASLSATGTASLSGTIDVSLLGGFDPVDGAQFSILTAAGGITDLGATFNLPSNFTASLNDTMTELLLTVSLGLDGDFNDDGIVNLADYTVWRDNLGATENDLLAGNGDGGTIGTSDYELWKANFGATSAAAAGIELQSQGANVPEPSSVILLASMAAGGALALRRRGIGQHSSV